MKIRNTATGALVGGLLTAPLIAIMYVADTLVGLAFVPFDLFDWVTRVLPGPLVTFGIDLMIDSMRFLGISVVDTAKTAEQISAVLQFLFIGIVLGAVFFTLLKLRRTESTLLDGFVLGALFGLPMIAISVAIGQSTLHPLANIVWLTVLFLGWGVALNRSYALLQAAETAVPAAEAASTDEVRTAASINRRQFLIRLGASAATVTVVGSGVGAILARNERRRLQAALDDAMAH